MITTDGKWKMEGTDRKDPNRIKTSRELTERIKDIGFLPLFANTVKGFSVEEMTAADDWWSDYPENDPWVWREVIAGEGEIAYGKLFGGRAGFVSREWFPYFASYRRDGYDFDSRYEDGLASRKQKKIIDILEQYETIPSYVLKKAAGFCKGGETGFEGAITTLQMQTYIVVRSFHRKLNKRNEEYGWSVADYTLSERLFGEEHIRSAYGLNALEVKEKIITRLLEHFPNSTQEEAEKLIR